MLPEALREILISDGHHYLVQLSINSSRPPHVMSEA